MPARQERILSDVLSDMQPWERQDQETDGAWRAFQIYRDLGESRSHAAVGRQVGKSRTWIGLWSTKYNWVQRAALYDSYLDRVALAARVEAIEKMEAVHAQVAGGYIAALTLPLRALSKDRSIIGEGGAVVTIPRQSELEKMETAQLMAVAESAARTFASLTSVERLARRADDAAGLAAQAAPAEGAGVPGTGSMLTSAERAVGFLSALRDAGLKVPLLDALDEAADLEPAEA